MIQELQKLIEQYIGESKHRTLNGIAAKSGVSYSTVRRVAQGEAKSIDLSNALSLLLVTADWDMTLAYLKRHFPEAGKYYETVAEKRSVTEGVDRSVEACLRDFSRFVVLALVNTPDGAPMQRVLEIVGKRAGPIVDELASADLVIVKNGVVLPGKLNLGVLDLGTQIAMTQHCLLFVSNENRGKRRQHAGVFTEGVSLEGQRAIHAALESVLDEIHTIAASHPGTVPVFYGALMGSFLSEADNA